MKPGNFISQLLSEGTVPVEGSITSFNKNDEEELLMLLRQYYQEDILEMPLSAPAFNETAALWAAKYFYTALQLAVLRDEGEAETNGKLCAYTEAVSPSTMYSVDLIFRYLPALLHLARGLAPSDLLVKILTDTLAAWPFSSAGTDIPAMKSEQIIFTDPSLKIAYIDRLVKAKNMNRVISSHLQEEVFSFAGLHLDALWPNAGLLLKTTNE